jgi:hypothetical protein
MLRRGMALHAQNVAKTPQKKPRKAHAGALSEPALDGGAYGTWAISVDAP